MKDPIKDYARKHKRLLAAVTTIIFISSSVLGAAYYYYQPTGFSIVSTQYSATGNVITGQVVVTNLSDSSRLNLLGLQVWIGNFGLGSCDTSIGPKMTGVCKLSEAGVSSVAECSELTSATNLTIAYQATFANARIVTSYYPVTLSELGCVQG